MLILCTPIRESLITGSLSFFDLRGRFFFFSIIFFRPWIMTRINVIGLCILIWRVRHVILMLKTCISWNFVRHLWSIKWRQRCCTLVVEIYVFFFAFLFFLFCFLFESFCCTEGLKMKTLPQGYFFNVQFILWIQKFTFQIVLQKTKWDHGGGGVGGELMQVFLVFWMFKSKISPEEKKNHVSFFLLFQEEPAIRQILDWRGWSEMEKLAGLW